LTLNTDDSNVVTMVYDNRLRVSEHKATSNYPSGGYMQNAILTYNADMHPATMDNKINDGFDRTVKFDFAGRLTANSFGTSGGKTVYDQTIGYDAFSQMTGRSTTHWGNAALFGATYVNGRDTSMSATYDQSGNQLHAPSRSDSSTQTSIFDAANRTTEITSTTSQPVGGGHHALFVRRSDVTYDGDGHAVKSREGWRHGVGTLTMMGAQYQVWSSVLGSAVTEVTAAGAKLKTNVFAGGAVT
jgi:hypothetical protein